VLVALAADPVARDVIIVAGATALVVVLAQVQVRAAPLETDVLSSHVGSPKSDERSGEGTTAECGKCLASRAGAGKPPRQGIKDLIVHA